MPIFLLLLFEAIFFGLRSTPPPWQLKVPTSLGFEASLLDFVAAKVESPLHLGGYKVPIIFSV